MRVYLDDLKDSIFWEYLPKDALKNLSEKEYLTFHYWYNDKMSLVEDIQNIKIEPKISLRLHKNAPNKDGIPYSLGYFQLPFDTQNTLFYQFLRYYYVTKPLYDNRPNYSSEENKKNLLEYFKNAKLKDLESIDFKNKKTEYGNVFNINTRIDFKNAIDRFVFANEQAKNELFSIVDIVDAYTKEAHDMQVSLGETPSFKKTIYGDIISKIVLGIKNPNGGLIPETSNKLRYLYVGENSEVLKADPMLAEAKTMVRNKFTYNEIFTKTGWFFNKLDGKWRKAISDANCELAKMVNNSIFVNKTTRFRDVSDYFNTVSGKRSEGILKLVKSGWDTCLSDVLKHDSLYKHYPQLYSLPIFLCYKNTNDYSFYFDPKNKYIMMYGDPNKHDIKTILLHETQHAIQRIENYATGGNLFFAKMISSIGGEGIRAYMNANNIIKQLYLSKCRAGDEFGYERFSNSAIAIILNRELVESEEYYDIAETIIEEIISLYINKPTRQIDIKNYVGGEIGRQLDIIFNAINNAVKVSSRLRAEGYDARMINTIFFSAYESLLGEIESRSVQKMTQIDEELRDYLTPYSVESIDEAEVTVLTDELFTDEEIPKRIKGAIEKDDEKKYIIHLFESPDCEPFLHELGHIVYDLIGGVEINQAISQNFAEQEIKEMGGIQEVFCELFISFILRTDIFKELNYELSENRKLEKIRIAFLERNFRDIFYSQTKDESEFTNRLKYLNELEKLILNNI